VVPQRTIGVLAGFGSVTQLPCRRRNRDPMGNRIRTGAGEMLLLYLIASDSENDRLPVLKGMLRSRLHFYGTGGTKL